MSNRGQTITPMTAERARALIKYNPETGSLHWKDQRRRNFIGLLAGWNDTKGYRRLRIEGHAVLAHRLAWLIVYGKWPIGWLDHINRDPADNRIANLREVTPRQNQANRGVRRDSRTGVKGVYRRARSDKWFATIALGSFDSKEDAAAAYDRAAALIHGDFFAMRSPDGGLGRMDSALARKR